MNLEFEKDTLEKAMIRNADLKGTPLSGTLELLPLCNMNCDMCYVRLSKTEMQEKGRLRTLQEWISMAEQMQSAGVLFLTLTGGEPLLYPEFKELYLELKKMGMIIALNTNGTLLDEEWAEFFSRHKPRRINVTLYGSSRDTYETLCHYPAGFEKAVNSIRLLKERNISVKVNCSAVQANKGDIEEIFILCQQLNVPVNVDCYMMPAVRERNKSYDFLSRLDAHEAAAMDLLCRRNELKEDDFLDYRERILWAAENILPESGPVHMSCRAGKTSFAITWQGNMQPCVMLKQVFAPVFETGFTESWKYIRTETEKILLNPKCGKCNLRPVCRNCAACALLEEGSYDSIPAYMCSFAEELLKQLNCFYSTARTDGRKENQK